MTSSGLISDIAPAGNDSDLIQRRYRGFIDRQQPVPIPRIWQRSKKQNPKEEPQSQAYSASTPAHHPTFPQLVETKKEVTAVCSNDDWSKHFLYLVDESANCENSFYEVASCPNTLLPCHIQSSRKRPADPSLENQSFMSSSVWSCANKIV